MILTSLDELRLNENESEQEINNPEKFQKDTR